jgi:hypothetical protein
LNAYLCSRLLGSSLLTVGCVYGSTPLLPLLLQTKYSWFMHGLREENIQLNRKMLSELAIFEPHSFKALVSQVQHMRPTTSSSSSSRSRSSQVPPAQS